MELRQLGNSEVKVTPITYGAWAIGGWMWGGADENDAIRAIRTAYDLGMTTIDTAPIYGFGKSEELVGIATEDIPRDKYQILTKYGMNWKTEEGEYYFDSVGNDGTPLKIYKFSGKEQVKKECEESLRRLKTDYIDLYQIHWPDVTTPISETMEAVEELIQEGKVRAAGVCNYNTELVEEALKHIPLATNQVPYSMVRRGIENDVIPQAIENKMHILPYSPLQRGLLTGKIKRDHKFKEGDARANSKYFQPDNIDRIQELLQKIKPVAEAHDATFAQIVLHWTMRQPGIGSVLAGARNEQQVKDNIKAVEIELTEEELKQITKAADEFELVENVA